MERAHLDPDSGAGEPEGAGGKPVTPSGAGGAAVSGGQNLPECTQHSDECLACLNDNGCSDKSAACLESADCRNGIYRHAACVANHGCRDMACATLLEKSPFVACYSGCNDQCADRAFMPICNLYCACMQDQCQEQFMDLGGSLQRCIDTCNSDPSIHDNALCREDHCELVPKYGADPHCQHAVGGLGMCVDKIPICLNKINTGLGPCENGEDCCSGNCQGNVCQP